ncbi:MAG TPA: YidB family protein [Terriglobales bacterium]|nr:YidB family protein [Terriglobales bacterium]
MSLIDDLGSKAANSMLGDSSNPLATGLLHMINNSPGGLSGMLQSFHDKGLGGLVSSWVGTGQNLPISADQIQHVLGSDQVKGLAAKAGISPDMASNALSQLLPTLVDKLTPNGQVPQHSSLLETGMSILNSLKSGSAA